MPGPRTPVRTRHRGPCGRRVPCWRPACRSRFESYTRTVEILDGGRAIAHCHGESYADSDIILRRLADLS